MIIENTLWPTDVELFDKLEGNYVSENERTFFQTLKRKMQSELAPCRDLIISELDNDDHLYLVRDQYDEFIVGTACKDNTRETHVMSLSEALATKLNDIGLTNSNITLFEWLRANNYHGAMYNHNNAYL